MAAFSFRAVSNTNETAAVSADARSSTPAASSVTSAPPTSGKSTEYVEPAVLAKAARAAALVTRETNPASAANCLPWNEKAPAARRSRSALMSDSLTSFALARSIVQTPDYQVYAAPGRAVDVSVSGSSPSPVQTLPPSSSSPIRTCVPSDVR